MILCAQCGKKNKDDATVCKHCGYNPGALRANANAWSYQNSAYPSMQYQQPMQQGGYYYDANGNAYNVRYDCKVTPVYNDDEEEVENGTAVQQMMLYPYNPTLYQQQQVEVQTEPEKPNAMAWVGYILAMFFDVLAWPFCWIGLAVANRRDGAKRGLCMGGMLFTLLRLLTALCLFLVWWGMNSFLPEFFVGMNSLKAAFVKMVLFGWPIAVGAIFAQTSAPDSGLGAAGRGYMYLSIAVAVVGIIFLDVSLLPIFS